MNTLDSNHSMQVDVLIIGGGPSGTSAGIALLKRGDMEVMLIERGNYSEEKYSESLSSGARSTMEYLDVWHSFASTQNLAPFYSQVSWGLESQRQLGYMFTPNGAGWNLDRLAFDRLMAKTFVKHGGRMLCESQVITCSRVAEGGWLVNVKSGDQDMQTIQCQYIIDASGRRGVMRTNLNLALTVHDRLIGIACVAHITTDTEVKIENQVEACKYGWWHMAPMADNRVSVVLMTDPDIAHKLQACHPDVWYGMLKELPFMGEIAKQLEFTERPRSFPCFSSFLGEAGGKDWVAVGDAVASYDPISSSGIPRALASGMHGAFIAVDSLLSNGELLSTYSQAIEQDFRQYLQTRWQYYQRETRWPDSLFWARRRAVIAISKEAKVHATNYFEQKLSTSPVHLKSNELQDLWYCCELGKSVGAVLEDFSKRHLHVPEQKVLLGLQELIESGYLDVSMEDEEDRVFFNTERLYFD